MKLNIKKNYPDVKTPTYGSEKAAGLDIYAYGSHLVKAKSRMLIPTGISVQWTSYDPDDDVSNYYLRIAPRSGLSVKHCVDIGAGVIDSDYRGEIKVCFINNGESDYQVENGDKIAQLILEKINRFNHFEIVENLEETTRGANGFGSTGIK